MKYPPLAAFVLATMVVTAIVTAPAVLADPPEGGSTVLRKDLFSLLRDNIFLVDDQGNMVQATDEDGNLISDEEGMPVYLLRKQGDEILWADIHVGVQELGCTIPAGAPEGSSCAHYPATRGEVAQVLAALQETTVAQLGYGADPNDPITTETLIEWANALADYEKEQKRLEREASLAAAQEETLQAYYDECCGGNPPPPPIERSEPPPPPPPVVVNGWTEVHRPTGSSGPGVAPGRTGSLEFDEDGWAIGSDGILYERKPDGRCYAYDPTGEALFNGGICQ